MITVARPPETRVRFTAIIIDLIYDYVTTILAHGFTLVAIINKTTSTFRTIVWGSESPSIRSEGRRKTVRINLDGVRNLSSRKKCWKYL